MRKTFCLISILVILTAGCLEAKDAWPALISVSKLQDHGWVQSGDVQMQSLTQEVSGVSIKINMAMMNYRNDSMARGITQKVREIDGLENKDLSMISSFSSQLITVRIVLPAGISLPYEVVNSMIKRQLDDIASQNNIKDFHEVDSSGITLLNGIKTEGIRYEGYMDLEGDRVKIGGVSASWPDSDSTIIVFGVFPEEDINFKKGQYDLLSIKFNGDLEYSEILKLIRNVE